MATHRTARQGFTLVEVLVVILIIAILVALLIPVIGGVMRRAENFRFAADLSTLDTAFEQYKNKYADYPPDFTDVFTISGNPVVPWTSTVAYRHIRKAFPKIAPDELQMIRLLCERDLSDPRRIDPAECVWFWLGGLSKNPKYPFSGAGGPIQRNNYNPASPNVDVLTWNHQREEPIVPFNAARLGPNPNAPSTDIRYAPIYMTETTNSTPYVYFDARTNTLPSGSTRVLNVAQVYPTPAHGNTGAGVARPYVVSPTQFANADRFQLICAGIDGIYGVDLGLCNNEPFFMTFPGAAIYHQDATCLSNMNNQISSGAVPNPVAVNDDNLTNFSDGQTLKDARP